MTHVEVLVEDDRWKSINFEDLVTKAFYETLKKLGYSKTDYFISVLGCNDKKMRKLNLMFRSKDTSTCLLYTSPSPRDGLLSRMPSSA